MVSIYMEMKPRDMVVGIIISIFLDPKHIVFYRLQISAMITNP